MKNYFRYLYENISGTTIGVVTITVLISVLCVFQSVLVNLPNGIQIVLKVIGTVFAYALVGVFLGTLVWLVVYPIYEVIKNTIKYIKK
ncbi:hypothetical protein [Lactococcus garvieae]|uniref:hypothetical protein n=1 Tax=Lactococcus garvieae TaxID=1363 RepID=UPI00385467F4